MSISRSGRRTRLRRKLELLAAALIYAALSVLSSASAVTLDGVRQLGTTNLDWGSDVSADGLGNVYISGQIGATGGVGPSGFAAAFVAKYDEAGNPVWAQQLGTSHINIANGVSADRLGNVYVAGVMDFFSENDNSFGDAFLAKYDTAGNMLWSRQLGASECDWGDSVSVDGLGNVYISGTTGFFDPFIAKYDAGGDLLWYRQLPTADREHNTYVSADVLGNAYIAGRTRDSIGGANNGGFDAWLAKYDAAGSLLWTRQLGTTEGDGSYGVSADSLGNVYISGYTRGDLASVIAGDQDAFVAKYDAEGTLLWTRQLGTEGTDGGQGVVADARGNVYLTGYTTGDLGGPNAGEHDPFVTKFDADGNHIWTHQFGTTAYDSSSAVSTDGMGTIFIAGDTAGSLGGPNAGGSDAFLAKFIDGLDGDFNNDGAVDAADYIVWRNELGADYTQGHYDHWRANFGKMASAAESDISGRATSAVPETSALGLAALAVLLQRALRAHPRSATSEADTMLENIKQF